MKKLSIFLLIVSSFIFLLSLVSFLSKNVPLETHEIYSSASVTENTGGFDLNGTALTFGKVSVGGSSTRSIRLTNPYDFPIRVESEFTGEINSIANSIEPMIIQPNNFSSISLSVSPPLSSDMRDYEGQLVVKLFIEN